MRSRFSIEVFLHRKIFHGAVGAQIQRVVGVSRLGTSAKGYPPCAILFAHGDHIPQAIEEVGAFFNQRAPARPHGRGAAAKGKHVAKRRQVFLVQPLIAVPIQIVGDGGALGIDVHHHKAVKAVVFRDALHRLQGGVQPRGVGGGGVDADADEGVFAPLAQHVAVGQKGGGGIQPRGGVVAAIGGGDHRLGKGQHVQFLCSTRRRENSHANPLLSV